MRLRLNVDICNDTRISGWAIYDEDPSRRVVLDLLVDGKFHAKLFARNKREDLEKAGLGDGRCAFQYQFSKLVRARDRVTISLFAVDIEEISFSKEVFLNSI